MKKKLAIILFTAAVSVSACSGPASPAAGSAASVSSEAHAEEAANSSLEAPGDITVKKELFDVKITVPAEYIGDKSKEELQSDAKENGYEITVNDDGSATYSMTKSQHKKMMKEFSDSLNKSLSEMIGSEDYPTFKDIKANDNFTEFTITTSSTELSFTESFTVLAFYMYGGIYNIYNGTPVDNIHVEFVNSDTGKVISSSDSKDMGETAK